jgi:hypothetical protein
MEETSSEKPEVDVVPETNEEHRSIDGGEQASHPASSQTKAINPMIQERVISQPSKQETPKPLKQNKYMNNSISTIEEENSNVSFSDNSMLQKTAMFGSDSMTEADKNSSGMSNSFQKPKRMKYARSNFSSAIVENKTSVAMPKVVPEEVEQEESQSDTSSQNKSRRANYAK